jgi:hypothetical protein
MRALLDSHKVNHVSLKIDESSSMRPYRSAVEQVVDGLVRDLAAQSEEFGQETRISVYAFGSAGTERCIVWDCDVLRFPSIAGRYEPGGMTALVDCEHLALDDMELIPQKYGDHAMIGYTVSDGGENDSRRSASSLRLRLGSLPANVSAGIFVPDQACKRYAVTQCGYPEGSVQIWNPSGRGAIQDLGTSIRKTNRSFFEGRSQGVRAARGGLFTPGSFSVADVQARLTPITRGAYGLYEVPQDSRIDLFVEEVTRRPYPKGRVYYQLTRPVTIQDYKDVLVQAEGDLYSGTLPEARSLLGLPDHAVKVSPRDLSTSGCKVFVQSTSYNRKLIGGTEVVVLR